MTQTAAQISGAINRWLEEEPALETEYTRKYGADPDPVLSWNDLIYHMLYGCVKDPETGLRWIEIPGVQGLIRAVTQTGGEGRGDETYAIFEVKTDVTRFFRMDGYYVSHDGFHYEDDELTEVHAVEKPVVFWDPV